MFWGPLLLVDKNNNTAKYLKHSLKILCLISTMGTRRHKPLCLEEPVWLWIYLLLSLNQTKTECFTYRNLLIVSYNLTETILCFFDSFDNEKEACCQHCSFGTYISKTENRGIQKKLTLHHSSYLFKWQNSKSSELLNIYFINTLCWLRYNQREVGSTIIFTSKFSFRT